ncbi:glutamate racemase [Campylobacter mucosalis]|uniref:glutamate racemase n=1 Tax=Campylobacter mucosalis TaxID=202 RepID=UPI0004D79D91|nr:glutamate racemase [Campylobacter mucosalis]KEA46403.1 hypothetical protein CR66_00675 [Campylobacter mucosalis]QKF63111.1 glutamate racemase [Campylobacter mucosalis]
MKVAFFDSGFGGLSVLNEALHRFNGCEFIYFADTKNVPYGVKSVEQITALSLRACEFLASLNVKAIIIACNTATSAAVAKLRANLDVPIIGMEPAVKQALKTSTNCILTATNATINGIKLDNLLTTLNAHERVAKLALPGLVEFAENLEFNSQNVREYLERELNRFDLKEYGSLVLGCTHFNYFKDTMREILPKNVVFIDGIDGTLRRLSEILPAIKTGQGENKISYFCSYEKCEKDEKIATLLARLEAMRGIK